MSLETVVTDHLGSSIVVYGPVIADLSQRIELVVALGVSIGEIRLRRLPDLAHVDLDRIAYRYDRPSWPMSVTDSARLLVMQHHDTHFEVIAVRAGWIVGLDAHTPAVIDGTYKEVLVRMVLVALTSA